MEQAMFYGSNITCATVASCSSFVTGAYAAATNMDLRGWIADPMRDVFKLESPLEWLDRRVDEIIDWAWRK